MDVIFTTTGGLALANTLSALKGGCELADTTIKGMGRGAETLKQNYWWQFINLKINISNYEFDSLLEEFKKLKKIKLGQFFFLRLCSEYGLLAI